MTAARRLEPPFSGAYGVSCRARAKRAALRRAKTAIRPWPPWWPLGPPPPPGGAGRSSAGHNDRGKIHKLSAVMPSGRTDRSSIRRTTPSRMPLLRNYRILCRAFCGYAPSTASTSASATSARGRKPEARTNSCGACAPPPSGPRPSTVNGIEGAKWLAALGPPRGAGAVGRAVGAPAPAAARGDDGTADGRARPLEELDRRLARVHARPLAHEHRLDAGPADLLGASAGDGAQRLERVATHVGHELAAVGHDVERVAGADDGRHDGETLGPVRVVALGERLRGAGEREQRVDPAVRRGARVRRAPVRRDVHRRGRLALDDHLLAPVLGALAALEAQAGVEPREAIDVLERADAPLLVADEQERGLGEVVAALGERAEDAERQHVAALHVDGPRPDEAVLLAAQRAVLLVRDHRVDVAEEQHALRPRAGQPDEQVGRVVRGRARRPLDLDVVGRQRGGDRGGLLGAVHVAARRGD